MTANTVQRTLASLVLCAALALARPAFARDELVLVVGATSRIQSLSSVEVHRLFLGLTVIVDDRPLRALRNESDELMRQIFFQNIVSMSESVYDRRALALTLQQGRTAPPVLHDTQKVFEALAVDPFAVSFAWAVDAAQDGRIKTLRVLWHR